MKIKSKRRLPAPTPTDAAEREYYRRIRLYTNAYAKLFREAWEKDLPHIRAEAEIVIPNSLKSDSAYAHMDSITDRITRLFDLVNSALESSMPKSLLKKWAKTMATQVDRHSKLNLDKNVTVATSDQEAPAVINPLLGDRGLKPFFQNVVDQNVALIQSIPKERLETFKNQLTQAISQDAHNKDLAKIIEKNLKVSSARARLIARDQVGKLNSSLTQVRQKQIGVRRYIWRSMRDEAVRGKPGGLYPKARPSHWELDGKTFRWDKPPVAGTNGERCHPGEAIQCRCYAEPVLEDILAD